MNERILVVEYDNESSLFISSSLARNKYNTKVVRKENLTREVISLFNPTLIVLDIPQPSIDGLDICRDVRRIYQGLIMAIIDGNDEMDQILCLELGANDFLTKPFSSRLILSKVKVLINRKVHQNNNLKKTRNLTHDGLEINGLGRTVSFNGRPIDITYGEFDVLFSLVENFGEILSREELKTKLMENGFYGGERAIDAKISRLRKTLEKQSHIPFKIKTIRNKGYFICS